jgi:hypothetical protein
MARQRICRLYAANVFDQATRCPSPATPIREDATIAVATGRYYLYAALRGKQTAVPPMTIATGHPYQYAAPRKSHSVHPRACRAALVLVVPPSCLSNHGGLTPAALGCVFASPRTLLDSRRPAFAFPNHGGLTPAALGCVFASPRTLLDSRRPAFALPNHGGRTPRRSRLRVRLPASIVRFSSATVRRTHHGGLTPAALGSVRLCIANVVLHCERTSCNQERLA